MTGTGAGTGAANRIVSGRSLAGAALWGAVLATILATASGQQRALPLRLWLIGFGAWGAAVLLVRLFDALPTAPARLLGVVPLPQRRRRRPSVDQRPSGLRSHEGLLIRARDHERTTAKQLRPRLRHLADHHLPRRHGIDPATEPGRVIELFGDVAWLLDPTVTDRAASLNEVETFFDRLLPIEQTNRSTQP